MFHERADIVPSPYVCPLPVQGIKFGVLDMDLPNVGWAATETYGVSSIPMFMIKLPGRLKLVSAPSIQGADALTEWARSQLAKLTDEERELAISTSSQKVPKNHEIPRDYVYKFTDPNTGSVIDMRTKRPWVEASQEL